MRAVVLLAVAAVFLIAAPVAAAEACYVHLPECDDGWPRTCTWRAPPVECERTDLRDLFR